MGWYVLSFVWIILAGVTTALSTGDVTASALTAVFAANVVLAGYIVVSVQEENKGRVTTTTAPGETRKTQ